MKLFFQKELTQKVISSIYGFFLGMKRMNVHDILKNVTFTDMYDRYHLLNKAFTAKGAQIKVI